MPKALVDLASELRAAVLGNEHDRAGRLAEQYTQEVARQWTLMSEAERVSSPLPKQSRELLTWARDVAIMHHAMAAQHLAAIGMANRYLTARANYLKSAAL
jgi:hypothetical protein